MIRPLQIIDIAVLLLFLGRSPDNEARIRDRFNKREKESRPLVPLLRDCVVSRDSRHSLVCAEGGLIRGLACLRKRGGPDVWEIEHLLLARGHEGCCLDLLERLEAAEDEIRVKQLFLRLDAGSPAVDIARQAGFGHYLTESLYCLQGTHELEPCEMSLEISPESDADEYRFFRLYSGAVPVQVRSVEGMTFQEWSQSRDRTADREAAFESEGELSAWLRTRVDGTAGHFELVTALGADELGQVVHHGLSILEGRHPVYCLVPEFQQPLRRVLEERGFVQVAEYSCLSKRFAVRVREPGLVPMQA